MIAPSRFPIHLPRRISGWDIEESCHDMWCSGEAGWLEHPVDAVWTLQWIEIMTIRVAHLEDHSAERWIKWFDETYAAALADGALGRIDDWDSMLTDGIHTPIVALNRGEHAHLWGGHHRLAAAFKRGQTHILGYIGTVKQPPRQQTIHNNG